jgi:hypothetical protein
LLLCGYLLIASCLAERSRHAGQDFSEETFTASEIDALKETTAVFVLRSADIANFRDFEAAIESAWKLTPVEVIEPEDLGDYESREGYSYFLVSATAKISTSTYLPHFYLTLHIGNSPTTYCRIELYPGDTTANLFLTHRSKEVIPTIYAGARIKNWTPGMLKLYLLDLQSDLENRKRRWLFEAIRNQRALVNLAKDTLFVPDYVLEKTNRVTMLDTKRHDPNDLFEHYPYPFKIISATDLSGRILRGEVRYVFDYVRSAGDNFARVYSLTDGLIFQSYWPMSLHLKAKNIRQITK